MPMSSIAVRAGYAVPLMDYDVIHGRCYVDPHKCCDQRRWQVQLIVSEGTMVSILDVSTAIYEF
jgi:hypothetical protein